jgi:hypothetical protein
MKTWAKIDSNNIVINVIKVTDEKTNVKKWLTDRFGGNWQQTYSQIDIEEGTDEARYYNAASRGFFWDNENKAFITPKPFDSWMLDENFQWQAPTPKPNGSYVWDEKKLEWIEV